MQKKGKGVGWSEYVLELMFISFRSIQDRFWLEKWFRSKRMGMSHQVERKEEEKGGNKIRGIDLKRNSEIVKKGGLLAKCKRFKPQGHAEWEMNRKEVYGRWWERSKKKKRTAHGDRCSTTSCRGLFSLFV